MPMLQDISVIAGSLPCPVNSMALWFWLPKHRSLCLQAYFSWQIPAPQLDLGLGVTLSWKWVLATFLPTLLSVPGVLLSIPEQAGVVTMGAVHGSSTLNSSCLFSGRPHAPSSRLPADTSCSPLSVWYLAKT